MKKVKNKENDLLYVAGLITKGKEKGKYVAVEVHNTQLLNPVEPLFEANKGMEYVVVGKSEKVVRTIFGRIVALAGADHLVDIREK